MSVDVENMSPMGKRAMDSSSSSDVGHLADPDAGLSEHEKKAAVSFCAPSSLPAPSAC